MKKKANMLKSQENNTKVAGSRINNLDSAIKKAYVINEFKLIDSLNEYKNYSIAYTEAQKTDHISLNKQKLCQNLNDFTDDLSAYAKIWLFLCQAKLNIDFENDDITYCAIRNGRLDVLKFLFAQCSYNNKHIKSEFNNKYNEYEKINYLHYTAKYGDKEIIDYSINDYTLDLNHASLY